MPRRASSCVCQGLHDMQQLLALLEPGHRVGGALQAANLAGAVHEDGCRALHKEVRFFEAKPMIDGVLLPRTPWSSPNQSGAQRAWSTTTLHELLARSGRRLSASMNTASTILPPRTGAGATGRGRRPFVATPARNAATTAMTRPAVKSRKRLGRHLCAASEATPLAVMVASSRGVGALSICPVHPLPSPSSSRHVFGRGLPWEPSRGRALNWRQPSKSGSVCQLSVSRVNRLTATRSRSAGLAQQV